MARPKYDLPEDMSMKLEPVGVMRSPYQVHLGTPRQPGTEAEADGQNGEILLRQGLQNLLKDLSGFSHIWVLFWCHVSYGWNHMVVPPRDTVKRGLFATRAPHRPNPIGMSVLPLIRVEGLVLTVGSHDILNGSPILDIKPYLPYADAIPDAKAGWVDELGDKAGPDHRDWQADDK